MHENIIFSIGQSSLGAICSAKSAVGICHIALGDDGNELMRELWARFPEAVRVDEEAFCEQIKAGIENPCRGFALPLDIRGTAFQQRVWQELRAIPVGETATYTQIAQSIDAPKSVRAVAGACAANTIAVVIPCHRVVKSDGALSGYRWGVERKRALLDRESLQRKIPVD